jgi:cyclophilin family peptidyl-prolyl cis-trans isomerase
MHTPLLGRQGGSTAQQQPLNTPCLPACPCCCCRLLYGSQARFFDDEISPKRKHGPKGCVGMASAGPDLNASQV